MAKYTPRTTEELANLLFKETWEKDSISFKETDIKLGDIDTRYITNMSGLFSGTLKRTDFSGIETWDTSKVKNMVNMFAFVKNFNADISGWDVSNVENMANMFFMAENFNQNLDSWDVGKVKDFDKMFEGTPLENNPPKWYPKQN